MANKEKKKFKITFFSDFKAFIQRGNIMDLAIAVIIGGAFSAIVTSLVNDIIMPLLNWAMGSEGGIAGASLVLNDVPRYLTDGSANPAALLWNYGNFLQSIINFLIIALCIFTAIRLMMKAKSMTKSIAEKEKELIEKKLHKGQLSHEEAQAALAALDAPAPAEAPAPETSEDILREIRDLLKAQAAANAVADANKDEAAL